MRVAIVGSPSFTNAERLYPVIDSFLAEHTHSSVTFVTGNMAGVERAAIGFANQRGLDCIVIRPSKPVDGTHDAMMKSVYQRNKQIIDNSDRVLIIWDGQSLETEHMIKYARVKEKSMMILTF